MDAKARGTSPMLLAANQRLYELRGQRELHGQRAEAGERPFPAIPVELPNPTVAEIVASLPAHLGWGSVGVARVVRGSRGAGEQGCRGAEEQGSGGAGVGVQGCRGAEEQGCRGAGERTAVCGHVESLAGETAVCRSIAPLVGETAVCGVVGDEQGSRGVGENGRLLATVKHYPSLGIAALEQKEAAALRVWLACRHLDGVGRGWLETVQLRQQVTGKGAPLKLCSWRRLRQILQGGNGRFWDWQGDRLWLHGAARVAAALGVTHFAGRPVDLPLTALTDGIGSFRAHLYAAWHSGRRASTPIARATQKTLLHVPERSQRRYCQRLNLKRQRHFAIGKPYNKERMEEGNWEQGTAAFEFIDSRGVLGRQNGRYVAWQLPNSYGRRHQPSRMGRQKKLQRQLTDLVNQGARGNGGIALQRQYHPNGKAAARAAHNQTSYWPARQGADWQLWFSLGVN